MMYNTVACDGVGCRMKDTRALPTRHTSVFPAVGSRGFLAKGQAGPAKNGLALDFLW